MTRILIPPPRVPLADTAGRVTAPWYAFFAQVIQGVADDVDGAEAALASLTARVTVAEGDVDALQLADTALAAADTALQAADAALQAADAGLFVDLAMEPDRGAEIDALRKRIAALETELALLPDRGAELSAVRARLRDLETDLSMG